MSTDSTVATGASFSAHAHGRATQRALLYVYLDRKACQAGTNKEAARDGQYKAGDSYFLQKRGGQMVKETWTYAWVSGSFKKSFSAHAGTPTGREYVCAYLDTKNRYGGYRVTAARGSSHHTVSN